MKTIITVILIIKICICYGQTTSEYFDKGISLYDAGNYQAAISYFSKAIEVDPNHSNSYKNRGICKQHIGDNKGAMLDYSKAIEINPNNATHYVNRGLLKWELGDNKGAILDYTEAININPSYPQAYCYRAEAHLSLFKAVENSKILNESLLDLNKAISLDSNYALAFFHRGAVRGLLGDKKNGCLDLSKAGELGYMDAYDAIKNLCN